MTITFPVDPELSALMSIAEILVTLSIACFIAYMIFQKKTFNYLQRVPLSEHLSADDINIDAIATMDL